MNATELTDFVQDETVNDCHGDQYNIRQMLKSPG